MSVATALRITFEAVTTTNGMAYIAMLTIPKSNALDAKWISGIETGSVIVASRLNE